MLRSQRTSVLHSEALNHPTALKACRVTTARAQLK